MITSLSVNDKIKRKIRHYRVEETNNLSFGKCAICRTTDYEFWHRISICCFSFKKKLGTIARYKNTILQNFYSNSSDSVGFLTMKAHVSNFHMATKCGNSDLHDFVKISIPVATIWHLTDYHICETFNRLFVLWQIICPLASFLKLNIINNK